jgi:murein DD-endopeptidase MepM/ murein hydrolase activator NlpD
MTKTKNLYSYPVELDRKTKTANDSPAHVGRLKHSIDFIVPENTPLKAAFDGVVVDLKQDSDVGGLEKEYDAQGNFIEIRHANREYSIYEHIRKNGSVVKIGDKVKIGQVIGYSGKTGWIAHLGAHLHFDVHKYTGKGREDYETLEIRWDSKI